MTANLIMPPRQASPAAGRNALTAIKLPALKTAKAGRQTSQRLNYIMTSMLQPKSSRPADVEPATFRIGSVSFLNARPLIAGLDRDERIKLSLEVPSKLLNGLQHDRFDTALLPVIDYQRMDGLRIIPAGGIGSDGETLTVRIFSRVPIDRITSVACDTDSHTSVALARVILVEGYGRSPEWVELSQASDADTMLLIGDKVVCEAPSGYPHQLDLGAAWKELTGLPFVFAAWTTRLTAGLPEIFASLHRARQQGMSEIESIIEAYARPRGWPAELARKYLTAHLSFQIGPRELDAIRLFHLKAFEHGVLLQPPRALEVFDPVIA